jgi:uncharacterized protein with HEPN domain
MPLDPADRGLLDDILTYGQRALRHHGGMTLDQFKADEKPRTAWCAVGPGGCG